MSALALWTMPQALELHGYLELFLRGHGFHVAIAGSVLYNGHSDKDLDLIIYPHHAPAGHELLVQLLTNFGFDGLMLCNNDAYYERDAKTVFTSRGVIDVLRPDIMTRFHKRIDIFFLQ